MFGTVEPVLFVFWGDTGLTNGLEPVPDSSSCYNRPNGDYGDTNDLWNKRARFNRENPA